MIKIKIQTNINFIKLILSFNAIKVHILNQKQLYQFNF